MCSAPALALKMPPAPKPVPILKTWEAVQDWAKNHRPAFIGHFSESNAVGGIAIAHFVEHSWANAAWSLATSSAVFVHVHGLCTSAICYDNIFPVLDLCGLDCLLFAHVAASLSVSC